MLKTNDLRLAFTVRYVNCAQICAQSFQIEGLKPFVCQFYSLW